MSAQFFRPDNLLEGFEAFKCVLTSGSKYDLDHQLKNSKLHYTIFEGKKIIYDNLLHPYEEAMTYCDLRQFYPAFANLVKTKKPKFFEFFEAGPCCQATKYYVVPLERKCGSCKRVVVIGNDLRCPSRLVALERIFLFAWGAKIADPALTAAQSSLEGYVYPAGGQPPVIGREAIYLSYKGYVDSGYDEYAYIVLRTFAFDATNNTVFAEWTWNAKFGPNGPQPGLIYSQDDNIAIYLDNCGFWRYVREYFNLNQLVSSFGPGGPICCADSTCDCQDECSHSKYSHQYCSD